LSERIVEMVAKCYARLEIHSLERLGPRGLEYDLMRSIRENLCVRGIECKPLRAGLLSVQTRCTVKRSVINIGLLTVGRRGDSNVCCWIGCVNHVPWWLGLLKRPKRGFLFSGEGLLEVCKEVAAILKSEERVASIEWTTPDEWHQFMKSEERMAYSAETVEDWFPSKPTEKT
jgi:hypothetical protein